MSEDQLTRQAETSEEGDATPSNPASNSAIMPRQTPSHDIHAYPRQWQPEMHHSSTVYPIMNQRVQRSVEMQSLMNGAPYGTPPDLPHPTYHYHHPYYPAPPSHRSIQSEPHHSQRPRASPDETYYSAQYNTSHYCRYHPNQQYWGSQHDAHPIDYNHYHQACQTLAASNLASSSAFASSGNDEYFPGTTPPHIGNNEEFPAEEELHSISRFKTPEEFHDLNLNPNEGFESPPSPTHQEPKDDTDNRKPAASVPDNIYLKTESELTPSPEITNYHESPGSATVPAPPPVPSFHCAETNKSDVVNSSSNSSSYGTSTSSSNSDFGWRRHYYSLVEFKDREGHCRVPQKHVEGSINLGVWVNKVRSERMHKSVQKCEILRH